MRLARFAALLSVAGALAAAPAAHGAGLQTRLRAVHDAGAPGAVALAGDRVLAAGSARRGGQRALTGRTPIRIGSVTKEFTAAIALQLVGAGRLSLSATVGELLPGALPAAATPTGGGRRSPRPTSSSGRPRSRTRWTPPRRPRSAPPRWLAAGS